MQFKLKNQEQQLEETKITDLISAFIRD